MDVDITMTSEEVREACAAWLNEHAGLGVEIESSDVRLKAMPPVDEYTAPQIVAVASFEQHATATAKR